MRADLLVDQVFADPQVRALEAWLSRSKQKDKVMRLVGQAMNLSRTPSRAGGVAARIGEHTDAVLNEFGFEPKEIAALRKANAI